MIREDLGRTRCFSAQASLQRLSSENALQRNLRVMNTLQTAIRASVQCSDFTF